MAQSESIAALAAALSKAQFEMQAARKDMTNPHFQSRYADLAALWDACRAALHENGLAVVQAPEPWDHGIKLRTVVMHTSGEWIDSVLTIPATKQDAQGYGSAMSYARRYGLSAMLGIVADDDDDGNAASRSAAARQEPVFQNVTASVSEREARLADLRRKIGEMEQRGLKLKPSEQRLADEADALPLERIEHGIEYFNKVLAELP